MAPFVQAINAEFLQDLHDGTSVFKGQIDPEWAVGAVPNGGYVLGLIIEATVRKQSATAHPDPIHLSAHFLRPTNISTFEVHIQYLKTGRGFTNLMANFIQEGALKVTVHMIFGVLTPNEPDAFFPKLVIEPPSPYARRIPFYTHPSQCPLVHFEKPMRYRKYIETADDPVHVKNGESPREGMEWGHYLTLTDRNERITPSAIAFAADMFVPVHHVVPGIHADVIPKSWAPTMVMTLEFKFPIPKASSPDHSPRTVAIYSAGKFMNDPQARHDAYVEVWTAPSNVGEGPERQGWREKQRCLAVSTQMALLVPREVNNRREQRKAAPVAKL